jgi:hypothetical protein
MQLQKLETYYNLLVITTVRGSGLQVIKLSEFVLYTQSQIFSKKYNTHTPYSTLIYV